MLHKQMNIQTFDKAFQEDPNAVLLDVRTPAEVAEGHLDGAIAIDFLAADFEHQAVAQLDTQKSYYVYCRSGKRSENACALLSRKGYQTTNLQGGYLAWLQK